MFKYWVLCLEFEEWSRLLKGKSIDANNPGRVLDPLEVKKAKLLARDEERSKRQTERLVLTKAMSDHALPGYSSVGGMTRAQIGSTALFLKTMFPFYLGVHEESGGTSSAKVITSKTGGTVTTMRM